MNDILTYEVTEGIQHLLAEDCQALTRLSIYRVTDVLPALELLQSVESRTEKEDVLNILDKNGAINELLSASSLAGRGHFRSLDDSSGLMGVELASRHRESWNGFQSAFKRRCRFAGFSKDHVNKMLATLIEFYDNVLVHSENVETGQVIFNVRSQRVELLIRDKGIGVLESLRQNPKFARSIDNHGKAMEEALKSNVSRFYLDEDLGAGRGFGFDELIVGLANCSEHIRFRSGDYCRECLRDSNGHLSWRTRQVTCFPGFSCNVIFSTNCV